MGTFKKINIMKMPSLSFYVKVLDKMTHLHSSHDLLLCLPIKITERNFIVNNKLGTGAKQKTEQCNTVKAATSY
jgi:hypothetical protein